MFRHKGKFRMLHHNVKIASLLSFVAGIVNVAGFLSIQRLTTNVTGHFAFFVDEVFKLHFIQSLVFFLYIFFFWLGSFTSNFLVEYLSRKRERYEFVLPAFIESLLLFSVAFGWPEVITTYPDTIAYSLLFAMGLQNSLVTRISGAMVRTTHLTGLFTDLGIEVSQLFFYKLQEERRKLTAVIGLRLTIIFFFFLGGIVGGIFYNKLRLNVLFIAAIVLITGLLYDTIRFEFIRLKRKERL